MIKPVAKLTKNLTENFPAPCMTDHEMAQLKANEQPPALLKDGLPFQAFAIVPDKEDPAGWQLPHHTREVRRAAQGKVGYEHTVDWTLLQKAVLLISRYGDEGRRVSADPEQIIKAARHLASHYRKAGRPVPDSLCVLI